MAEKTKKPIKDKDTKKWILAMYLGSIFFYFAPGLLAFFLSEDDFLKYHGLQSALVNIILIALGIALMLIATVTLIWVGTINWILGIILYFLLPFISFIYLGLVLGVNIFLAYKVIKHKDYRIKLFKDFLETFI